MVRSNWTLSTYVNLLKAASSILVLTTNLWIALLQPNLFIFGVCVFLCSISLIGLRSLQRTLFAVPFLALAIILISTIVTTPVKGLMVQMTQSLQFLLLVCTIEVGSSTIYFNRIFQRTRGQTACRGLLPAMAKALKRYVASLTAIIVASFVISSLLLFLGNAMEFRFEPLFLVAAATSILLVSLVFLGTDLRSPSARTEL